MKTPILPKRSSLVVALFAWALLSLLTVFIIWGYRDRARLIRDNDNERIFNALFTSFRDYDDFESAIDGIEILRDRITGFAIYASDTSLIYQWGTAPDRFDPSILEGEPTRRYNRYTIPDRRSKSIKFVIHNEKPPEPRNPPSESRNPPPDENTRGPGRNRQSWFFSAFSDGNYVYIDISHSAYWNTITLSEVLYPVCILALLALVLAVRFLYLRNIEYRERIEAQQNLVVLGTAASTLAHEIKNPLHSIKLQTGILKKLGAVNGEAGTEEIARIEEEVDRLAALTYKVNDYLRDAAGSPESINPAEIIEESSRRLCELSILAPDANRELCIRMDGDRARSVFENIIRNALEAGGPAENVSAQIKKEGGRIIITIEDRGKGIAREDLQRVFDPFYTSKSTGTGIGLAISKRFVEAAGGAIAVENRTGSGAAASAASAGISVRISLPCES
jgi:two-component system sensor histidine kinase HydH